MKTTTRIAALVASGLAALVVSAGAKAQVPYVLGTWELNAEASDFPGPPPQRQVRNYRLRDDGVLIGEAVIIDAEGRPRFLIFAGPADGSDVAEFDSNSAAAYLADGTLPPRTYAEIATDDPRRVEWGDKLGGEILFGGEKWVSEDGQTLNFTVVTTDENGAESVSRFVFDRTGD